MHINKLQNHDQAQTSASITELFWSFGLRPNNAKSWKYSSSEKGHAVVVAAIERRKVWMPNYEKGDVGLNQSTNYPTSQTFSSQVMN